MTTKTKPKSKRKEKAAKGAKPLRGGNSDKPADDGPAIRLPEADNKEPVTTTTEPEPESTGPRLDVSKAYDSPEALAAWDAETARESEERRLTRSELMHAELASKRSHKADKAALDEFDTEYWKWLRGRKEMRGKPPQPTMAPLYKDPDAKGEGLNLPKEPVDDAWKSVRLDTLDLPAGIIEKLADPVHKHKGELPPITTLGELTAYQEPEGNGYEKRLTDLNGIGPGAAEKIGVACEKFWEKWNREAGERAKAAAETQPEDEEADDEEDTDDEGDDDDEADEDE